MDDTSEKRKNIILLKKKYIIYSKHFIQDVLIIKKWIINLV